MIRVGSQHDGSAVVLHLDQLGSAVPILAHFGQVDVDIGHVRLIVGELGLHLLLLIGRRLYALRCSE